MKQTPITKSARGETCALRIPGVCNGNRETTVFAHAPCVDKGMGIKSPGWWGSYACSSCHDEIDGRRSARGFPTKAERDEWWLSGIYETLKKLIAKGLIRVG